MLYLRRFSLPGQGAEASFLARDSENKRTCYGSRYPFGIFLSRKVPPLTFEPITILCGGNGSGKTTVLNLMAEKLELRRGSGVQPQLLFSALSGSLRGGDGRGLRGGGA